MKRRRKSANPYCFLCFRRETVQVQLGRLRVAIRAFGRIDTSLPQAHWREAVQVPAVRPMLFPQRPPSPPHEETRVINRLRGRSRPGIKYHARDRRDLFLVKIARIFGGGSARGFTRSSIFRESLAARCKWKGIEDLSR